MARKNFSFSEVEINRNFPSRISTQVDWEPSTNILETEEILIIEVELPGVNKDDISILLHGSELVIKGKKLQNRLDGQQVTYYLFEREFGSFYKKIIIDYALEEENIKSNMENGVLTIQVPRKKSGKVSVDIK